MEKIILVDYGMGNLSSVAKALRFLGATVTVSSSPKTIGSAKKILLPGVGAFGDAMKELRKKKLLKPIQDHLASEKKFLGICLGLQLLFEKSAENKTAKGLGITPGEVIKFKSKNVKIPHMGWNHLHGIKDHPVLQKITEKDFFYFVHSFYGKTKRNLELAKSKHGRENFLAVVGNENYIATQFHPEKSQKPGLQILKNFIRW